MKGVGVLVVGAGGHARVCIDLLEASGLHVNGCLSADGAARAGISAAVLGRDGDLEALVAAGHRSVFVAIGDNRARLALLERARSAGAELVNAVSPHAVLAPSVVLGGGVALMAGAVVNAGTALGDGTIVNTNASIDHDGVVGAAVHVAPGCAVAGDVTLGEGAFLGIGSCVTPGRTIGAWAVVGAGAAVVHDVAPGLTVVGVPARPIARP